MQKISLRLVVFLSVLCLVSSCSKKVKIVEFVDYQCPYCKMTAQSVKKLKQNFEGKVEIEVKNLPIVSIHPYSLKAAFAAECAREQGRFWDMYFQLFKQSPQLSEDDLLRAAATLGLDMEVFIKCMGSERVKAKVDKDVKEAKKLGVQGTPAFVISGEVLSGFVPYETLKRIVEALLKKGRFRHGEVLITVINDEKCPTCGTTRFLESLKKVFFNNRVINYSVHSKEGKNLKKNLNIRWLPAFIIGGAPQEYAQFYTLYPTRLLKRDGFYIVNPVFYQIGYSDDVPPVDPLTTVGPANPDVIVIHFTAYGAACRWCGEAFSYIDSAVKTFKKHVAVSYKFLVSGSQDPSYEAVMATLCAAEQGALTEMMRLIFSKGFSKNYTPFAKAAGVKDLKEFGKCLKERKYHSLTVAFSREAVEHWVPYAPYTFINNFRFPDVPNPKWFKGILSDLIRLSQAGE